MSVLHGEPTLGRAADRLGQTERHFRRDTARSLEDTAERRGCYIQLFSKLAATDAIGLKIDVDDELAGVGRVMHSH
jgi:hypothetical protein